MLRRDQSVRFKMSDRFMKCIPQSVLYHTKATKRLKRIKDTIKHQPYISRWLRKLTRGWRLRKLRRDMMTKKTKERLMIKKTMERS